MNAQPTTCLQTSVDRLAGILSRLRLAARVIAAAPLTDAHELDGGAHLHVLFQGRVAVTAENAHAEIDGPAAILVPGQSPHRVAALAAGTDMLSASIDLGGGANPLAAALPPLLPVPLDQDEDGRHLRRLLDLMRVEAGSRHCGHQTVLDRLAEAALVLILRRSMDTRAGTGLLAGLAHPQLALALTAMHDRPGHDWTLETLAETAGQSRSAFADTFHQVVGMPPGHYLAGWRMALARVALDQGHPVKAVARDVGYASPAALSRAISRHFGANARELVRRGR